MMFMVVVEGVLGFLEIILCDLNVDLVFSVYLRIWVGCVVFILFDYFVVVI